MTDNTKGNTDVHPMNDTISEHTGVPRHCSPLAMLRGAPELCPNEREDLRRRTFQAGGIKGSFIAYVLGIIKGAFFNHLEVGEMRRTFFAFHCPPAENVGLRGQGAAWLPSDLYGENDCSHQSRASPSFLLET